MLNALPKMSNKIKVISPKTQTKISIATMWSATRGPQKQLIYWTIDFLGDYDFNAVCKSLFARKNSSVGRFLNKNGLFSVNITFVLS